MGFSLSHVFVISYMNHKSRSDTCKKQSFGLKSEKIVLKEDSKIGKLNIGTKKYCQIIYLRTNHLNGIT